MLFQKLRPRGLELQQGELGDLVEQEMAATSAAVESAAARIEVTISASLLQVHPSPRIYRQQYVLIDVFVFSLPCALKEMLNKSRAVDTGIKMEVNER